MTLTIIVERHSDILDLVFGPGDGMHRDDTAYMKRRAAYYAKAEKNLVAGAYLKNIDPLELKKLVHAEVVV